MPGEVASQGGGRTDGTRKTGLELSDNARRDFIVSLAEQLRNLDSATAILELAAKLLGEFLEAERAGAYYVAGEEIVIQACWTRGRLPHLTGARPISVIGPTIIANYRARRTAVTADVVAAGLQPQSETYSAVGVPLFRKGVWEGTFFINCQVGENWQPNEISLIEEAAELAWDAHEHALMAQRLREAKDALELRDAELSAALRAASLVPFDFDMRTGMMKPSRRLAMLYGYPPDKVLSLADIRARYHPDMSAAFLAEVAAKVADPNVSEFELDLQLLLPGGKVRWLEGRGQYFRDDKGAATRALGVVTDVTERKEMEKTQRLLVREMDHRIKNVLAMVLAIGTQTIRTSETLHGARIALVDRIQALAGAHDILVKSKWRAAGIRDVIAGATASFPAMSERVSFSGPDCMLSSKQALMLSLGLHELIANAVKYGALSSEHGMVGVTWRLAGEQQNQLILDWEERDGLKVVPPRRTGFGTRILADVLPAEFEGKSSLDYARSGFRFHLEGKLAQVPA